MWYKNICSASFSFVTIHACDRQTDRQNYNSQDRPRICSRGKNRQTTLTRTTPLQSLFHQLLLKPISIVWTFKLHLQLTTITHCFPYNIKQSEADITLDIKAHYFIRRFRRSVFLTTLYANRNFLLSPVSYFLPAFGALLRSWPPESIFNSVIIYCVRSLRGHVVTGRPATRWSSLRRLPVSLPLWLARTVCPAHRCANSKRIQTQT